MIKYLEVVREKKGLALPICPFSDCLKVLEIEELENFKSSKLNRIFRSCRLEIDER